MQEQEKKTRGRKQSAKQTEVKEAEKKPVEYSPAVIEQPNAENPITGATFTLEQVQKMIEEALAKRDSEHKPEQHTQNSADAVVTMIFQAEVNDSNELLLGPNGKYGMITGKHAIVTINKRDFVSDFRTTMIQYLLKNRNLIVVSGLSDEERKIYGVDYQQGEYLEPAVYDRLIEMGDGVVDFFEKLHVTWQEMVATKFVEAYENKTLKCSREALLEMNRISKKNYTGLPKDDARRKGAFYSIIHEMNAADESEE